MSNGEVVLTILNAAILFAFGYMAAWLIHGGKS